MGYYNLALWRPVSDQWKIGGRYYKHTNAGRRSFFKRQFKRSSVFSFAMRRNPRYRCTGFGRTLKCVLKR